MKLNEIMIGDWVYVEKIGKPVRVESVGYTAFVGYEHFQEIDGSIYGIKPIPLTKEILLKNGFEEFCGDAIIKKLSEDEIPTLYVWENNSICVVDYCSLNKYTYIKDCKYVHEFQHELKSCGINKEIVL